MRRHTKALLFILVILISVAATAFALRGPKTQDPNPINSEDATPLQETMTERQKQHSKLYGRHGRKDLRKIQESVRVFVSTPFAESDIVKTPSNMEELLKSITCNADAIVIATVENKSSQFTEDGGFVFTDYDVRIEEILKNNATPPIEGNRTLSITRPGGAVKFDGKIVKVVDASFGPLSLGNKYLLFLNQVSTTGAYKPVDSEGSFELKENSVRRLTAKELSYPFIYNSDTGSFLQQIRTIANLCNAK